MIAMVSMAGCQEAEPSRTIVSLQIDSDGENNWIYVYTIPRIKMGNLTITVGDISETHSSVFSHQVHMSNEEIDNITEGTYFSLIVSADLKNTNWEFMCKIRIVPSEVDEDLFVADVLIEEGDKEVEKEWQLPYNLPLEFKS
jgi:predicted methyltransferase MtxX (methanogen marker protein 4)